MNLTEMDKERVRERKQRNDHWNMVITWQHNYYNDRDQNEYCPVELMLTMIMYRNFIQNLVWNTTQNIHYMLRETEVRLVDQNIVKKDKKKVLASCKKNFFLKKKN